MLKLRNFKNAFFFSSVPSVNLLATAQPIRQAIGHLDFTTRDLKTKSKPTKKNVTPKKVPNAAKSEAKPLMPPKVKSSAAKTTNSILAFTSKLKQKEEESKAKKPKETSNLIFKPEEKATEKATAKVSEPASQKQETSKQQINHPQEQTKSATKQQNEGEMVQHIARVSIIGNTNAGKSTLLNTILGKKVSAVSQKVQTTRNNILGIKVRDDTQMIFYDTPGIIDETQDKSLSKKNASLFQEAFDSLQQNLDLVMILIDGTKDLKEINHILRHLERNVSVEQTTLPTTRRKDTRKKVSLGDMLLQETISPSRLDDHERQSMSISSTAHAEDEVIPYTTPEGMRRTKLVAVLNKVDLIQPRSKVEELLDELENSGLFHAVFEISALKRRGVENLLSFIQTKCSREEQWMFSPEKATDLSDPEIVMEIIKEKIFKRVNGEIPYQIALQTRKFKVTEHDVFIEVIIWTKNEGQKKVMQSAIRYIHERSKIDILPLFKGVPKEKIFLNFAIETKK